MASSVILKSREGGPLRKEGVTDEAITPGHLIERGGANDVQKHSSANGNALPAFALENDLVGDDIDDDYASGETVQYAVFAPGEEVNALLAYGENVSEGAALTSAGDGTLHAAAGSDPDRIVGYAAEDKNNTTGGSAVRIAVEVA